MGRAMTNRKPKHDYVGRQFGRLMVTKYIPGSRATGVCKCLATCACGAEVVVGGYALRTGKTKSCGCLSREMIIERNNLRRLNSRRGRPEYAVWSTMKARCMRPSRKDYPRYGGRGITVCAEWVVSFDAFYADMGARPSKGYSIERIDNDGPYSPSNCRWATLLEQANNRSNNAILSANGVTQTVPQWARETGLSPQVIKWRMKNGWSHHDSVTVADGRKI